MKTLTELVKEKGARIYTERYTEPDGLYVEIKNITLTEAQLQAAHDAYCKQFEPAGELRCDATTGHTYSPFWYSKAPPIGTKIYLAPQPISQELDTKRIDWLQLNYDSTLTRENIDKAMKEGK